MRRAAEKLIDSLGVLTSPSMEDVRQTIEDQLARFHADHIYPNPRFAEMGQVFEFLIAVYTAGDGYELFRSSQSALNPVKTHDCIGSGVYVSEYAIDIVYDPGFGLTIDEAKFLAAFSIKAAKDYVNSCGGATKIHAMFLNESGKCIVQNTAEVGVKFREEQSVAVYESFKILLKAMDVDGIEDGYVETFTDHIRDVIIEFRKKQRRKKDAFKRRQEALKSKV